MRTNDASNECVAKGEDDDVVLGEKVKTGAFSFSIPTLRRLLTRLRSLIRRFPILEKIFMRYPRILKFAAINVLAHLICFWGPNIFLHICYRFSLFKRYKIQDRLPPALLVRKALVDNILNDLLLMPLLSAPILKLLDYSFGEKEKKKVVEEDERSEEPKGWARLRLNTVRLPSAFRVFWQVAVAYLGYDTMFYWSHRLLHQKAFYMKIHKQHHRFSSTIGVASSYQHPIEGAVQLLNWYIPIGFAGYIAGDLHWFTLFVYNCFRWLETVDAHSGYAFPWSPFNLIPLFGGAVMHDFHHSGEGLQMIKLPDGSIYADFGNYGATIIWDWLMGTMSPAFVKSRK